MSILKQWNADQLSVVVADSRDNMGKAAAARAASILRELLAKQDEVRMIFAAAPSQNETLAWLSKEPDIDWNRVHAFHMDEYIGLPEGAPQRFAQYLDEHIFSLLPFASIHYLNAAATDPQEECRRYSALLNEKPIDMVCLGIGENGHIAFNDPWVAHFDDPETVKVVPLDEVCRNQQVNDGCFAKIDDVPTHAMTLTIPTLTNAAHLICTVPAKTKEWAVTATVTGEISEQVPATVMRRHPDAALFCDPDSAAGILN